MARLFITSGETYGESTGGIPGGTMTQLVGSRTGHETVFINANGDADLDGSFNAGGDIINILGNAGSYSGAVVGSKLVLTSSTGANISIPVGSVGATINFADSAGRVLVFDPVLNKVLLGSQSFSPDGPTLVVDSGAGNSNLLRLTVGQDNLTGNASAQTFRATVAQNASGEQANQLGTGDELYGAGGTADDTTTGTGTNPNVDSANADKLIAWVQDASPLNASPSASIMPFMIDVEVAHFNALTVNPSLLNGSLEDLVDGVLHLFHAANGPVLGVEINAKESWGLAEVGSVGSDDSLTIYNVNTLKDSGDYATRRATKAVTIRMDHTGNGNLVDLESDLTVLFDQDYLKPGDSSQAGSRLIMEIMDMDAALLGRKPLEENPYGRITFTADGKTFFIEWSNDGVDEYPELRDRIQAAVDKIRADGTQPGFPNLKVTTGGNFTANDTDTDPGGSRNDGVTIVMTNQGPEKLVAKTMSATREVTAGKDFHTNFADRAPEVTNEKITSQIELLKVGRGADGGDLTVGGMATDGLNILGNGTGKIAGVEQFNVHVEGDETQWSSLASLQSTNNALECVFVDNATQPGSKADLVIGNANTVEVLSLKGLTALLNGKPTGVYFSNGPLGFPGDQDGDTLLSGIGGLASIQFTADLTDDRNNALKDVQLFDSTKFANDVELHTYFSQEVVAKYLNVVDTQFDPYLDNILFEYKFGGGNDLLNANFNKDNLALIGTATREDFEFLAQMGNGDDVVELQIGDGQNAVTGDGRNISNDTPSGQNLLEATTLASEGGLQTVQNWYLNHVINQDRFGAGAGSLNTNPANINGPNMVIQTGIGNDIVRAWGASAYTIDLGDGNDVAYTDNSGVVDEADTFNEGKATWVFNSLDDGKGVNPDVDNLQSQAMGSVAKIANIRLKVTFQGLEATVDVGGIATGGTQRVSSVGAVGGVTITDLDINQAIKKAINEDPVLKFLLVAEDGPSRTLIVRSLIDGEHNEPDLTVNLVAASSTAILGAGVVTLATVSAGALDDIGFVPVTGAAINGDDQRYNSQFGQDRDSNVLDTILHGYDSVAVNNNVVEGETGDDIIVYSSNGIGEGIGRTGIEGNSVETFEIDGKFNDGVKRASGGSADHKDTVLNFTAANVSQAQLEEQIITFTGPATGNGSVTVTYNGVPYTFNITIGMTADDIAAGLDALMPMAVAGAPLSGELIITGPVLGVDYDEATVSYSGTAETQTITFSVAQTDGATVTVNFNGHTVSELIGSATAYSTAAQVGDRIAFLLDGFADVIATDDGNGVVTMTAVNTGDIATALVTFSSSVGVQMNAAVATPTPGTSPGITDDVFTSVNGAVQANGYDIFDVETVLAGKVQDVSNDTTDSQAIETAIIQEVLLGDAVLGDNEVGIIDRVDFGPATTELARIQAVVTSLDTGAMANGKSGDGIIITVDENNVGTFYHIQNGVNKGDATVAILGSVELAEYWNQGDAFVDADQRDKNEIGDWDLMTIANFTPLNAAQLIGTFDQIG